jgi:DNA-binding SARP family transcriptional activator/predicted ATPase
MPSITVKLLGTAHVLKDDSTVTFPFKKAEALFYYLAVTKQASRDQLAALLWPDSPEDAAKKKLRDAMYKIRKAFGIDIIICPQKQVITLNPQFPIHIDIDNLSETESNSATIPSYTGDFLDGFLLKDAEAFLDWAHRKQEFFREIYIKLLYKHIDAHKDHRDFDLARHARLLIRADEFDETAYRLLMKALAGNGAYNKAISVYNRLTELLDRELGIAPESQTRDLYVSLLEKRKVKLDSHLRKQERFFYGRTREMETLTDSFHAFTQDSHLHSSNTRAILITGEAGIGKTSLKDEFLHKIDPHGIHIIETNCYQAEETFMLKPWNHIMSSIRQIIDREGIGFPQLWENIIASMFPAFLGERKKGSVHAVEKPATLKTTVVEEAIVNVLNLVAQRRKILLIFEDIQWIDAISLSLLNTILLHAENNHVMFIGTMRTAHHEGLNRFVSKLCRYDRLMCIELHRFSRKETEEFISGALQVPNRRITEELKDKLFRETEGNPFFIAEFLNALKDKKDIGGLTSRMHDILKSRIMDISPDGRKALDIMSMFFDKIALETLLAVSGKDEYKIIEIIDELKSRNIVREFSDDGQIWYSFTHQKLRDFVYSQQSLARKKILHNRIGTLLESRLKLDKRDIPRYPLLIYHFSNGGNILAALKYSIKNANVYLDFGHELFPELNPVKPGSDDSRRLYAEAGQHAVKYIEDIELLMEKVTERESITDEIIQLEVEFLHMKGRYLIREGQYDSGVQCIRKVIRNALDIDNYKYALKGYLQMIFYTIQVHLVEEMEENVEAALSLAEAHDSRRDIGILLRLKGLNRIMAYRFDEAESDLKRSIEVFTRLSGEENRYALNTAAAYNYIGEIRRNRQNFREALKFYDKAIAFSLDSNALSSLAIFYTNAGQAAYDSGDHPAAMKYFSSALRMYNKFHTLWGRSTAEAFTALLLVNQNRYPDALIHLNHADLYSQQLKNPYRMGLVLKIKAEIRKSMLHDPELHNTFAALLDKPHTTYVAQSSYQLEKTGPRYELDLLKAL